MDLDDANTERVRRYSKAQNDRGLARIPVWVPRGRADELRRCAAALRRKDGMLLPRESAGSGPAYENSPLPPGDEIYLDQLLEIMAAARDEPPEQTLSEICFGRGPLGIAAAFARIAGRLGYVVVWRQKEVAAELAELRSRWLDTKSKLPAPTSALPPIEKPATKPSRNGPCPCGSGKKYKRCCAAPKS